MLAANLILIELVCKLAVFVIGFMAIFFLIVLSRATSR